MKISYQKYPMTILTCLLWSAVTLFIILLDVSGPVRVILGLPIVLFIPGYVLIFALFPSKKTDQGIDVIERIALSLGLSLAVVPLIGLGLNYTPWGIRLTPIILSLEIFIFILGGIATYRWFQLPSDERFTIDIDISFPKQESKLDKVLTIILAASIVIAASLLVYVIITPKTGEKFTEFYLLGSDGIADDYPRNLTTNENATVIIGVVNHEYRTINYTVEIWLVNQSYGYNESSKQNETTYYHAWFMDSFNTTLEHVPIDIEETWEPQWEMNYTFSINHTGEYKLAFLLYIDQNETYDMNTDYKDIADRKFDSEQTDSYRNLHLWLNIS